jgi:uncharacterized membrane protein
VTDTPPAPSRLRSIDLVRGLVMVVMVLDHTRDFYFGFHPDPTDLEETTPFLFFTRWITHYCAPGFVMLAGAAAFLYGRTHTLAERRKFLLTRGLWLVVLELTVVHFGWDPEPSYSFVLLQVIWAIGWSMVLLVPFVGLSPRVLAAGGLAMVATHDLLDDVHLGGVAGEGSGLGRFFWSVVHEQHGFAPVEGVRVLVAYPLVPWVGVMAMGFAIGELFTRDAKERQRMLVSIGGAAIALFVLVRGIDRYGDPSPWSVQRDAVFTLISFLNCTKYPPSLDYLLMTLGPILLLLAAFERWRLPEPIATALETFGRVPLFFYVIHLYLLSISAASFAFLRWGADTAFSGPPDGHRGCPEWPLWAVYVVWASAITLLFFPSRWFAALKQQRGKDWWWLAYF